MHIGRMAYPFVAALVVLCSALAAGSCDGWILDRPIIAYVGYLDAETDAPFQRFKDALRRGEPELFRRARIEYITGSDTDDASLTRTVRAAAQRRPTVLVAPTGTSAQIAARVAGPTPVVFAGYLNPVRAGIVKSMRVPGGHITGVSQEDWLDGKRLEILHDAFPSIRSVAVLTDRSWAEHYNGPARITADAQRLGIRATVLLAQTQEDVDELMSAPAAALFDAWYVPPTYVAWLSEAQIIRHLQRLEVPGVFGTTRDVASGGHIGYEQDTSFVWPTVARLVARVAAGEDAGSIPVERPRRYLLAVRANAQDRFGLISAQVVRRADLVY
jgi:putative tryptophan/tyrosine transport system substrate-binding protein